ncbi:MAG: glycosyltransferase, partial [Deltaproteobacteria bacterium]
SKVNGYPTLLFQHNVESMLTRRHFETAQNPISKLFWWSQWIKMDWYERMACQNFDGVVAVSGIDQEVFRERFAVRNAYAIPTGVDTEYFSPTKDSVLENSLVFTGAMDWLPNEDAILYFAREILGKIKEQIPDVKLTVVGRNPSQRLLNELERHPEIEVTGWVDDVRAYIGRSALYIIPLRIGGGTRIKAYEAMAMGKAIVSTSIGTEGLPVSDGENLVLADSAETFADAVVGLLKNSESRRAIEKAAREYVEKHVSWEKAAEAFANICRRIPQIHHGSTLKI